MRRWIVMLGAVLLVAILSTAALANGADWSLTGPPELPLADYEGVEGPLCTKRTLDQSPLRVGDVDFMVDVLTADTSKPYPVTARVFRTSGEGWRVWPTHGDIESDLGASYAEYQEGRGTSSFAVFEDNLDHLFVHHRYVPHKFDLENATDVHFSLTFDTYREHLLGFTPGERVTLEFDYTLRLDECP